jgi:N-methylhydantoinase A
MQVDVERAWTAIGRLAEALDVTPQAAAGGIHEVVNEMMAGAARVAISEHGRVPSEYALLATGGAGPVHAWQVARRLGVKRLICPPAAGVGSTIGMLMAPARVDRAAAFHFKLSPDVFPHMSEIFADMAKAAEAVVATTGADLSQRREQRIADMRYVGQGFETSVVVPENPNPESLKTVFEATYRALYGRVPDQPIHIIALRLSLTAPLSGADIRLHLAPRENTGPAGARNVWFPEVKGLVETPVFARASLAVGTRISGPAVLEEDESTLIIGPGGSAVVHADGCIVVDLPQT